MPSILNTYEVFDQLSKKLASFCIEVTGKTVVEGNNVSIPVVEGEFLLIEESGFEQQDWQDNEWQTSEGIKYVTHNYTATYTLTAFRGRPLVTIAKILQAMNTPFIYNKYFGGESPFSYSSSSSASRMRVPLNGQYYEERARAQIIFNVKFVYFDTEEFEDIREIVITTQVKDQSFNVVEEFDTEVKYP